MKKIKKVTNKVKEKTNEVKEVIVDNKGFIIVNGIAIVFIVGGIVLNKLYYKNSTALWTAAKKAYKNGDLNHDFGPYKVMKFFEPKTGEFLGDTIVHKDCMKMFLNIK